MTRIAYVLSSALCLLMLVLASPETNLGSEENCFVAGTLVWTDQGPIPIEDVRIGDQVFSLDLETGKVELQPVIELFQEVRGNVVKVLFHDTVIACSDNHRFYVEGDWIPAQKLAGMNHSCTEVGHRDVIDVVEYAGVHEVFNFSVYKNHNYFVGEEGILVHNRK